jgi:glucose/arabinose dehydrogenase
MASPQPFRPFLGPLVAALVAPSVQAGSDPIDYQGQTLRVGAREQTVTVPAGYRLEVMVSDLKGPRLLSFAENGDLFVGSRSGQVYRLAPPYLKAEVLVELDGYPHSVASRPGELLVARTDGVYRAAYRPGQAQLAPSDFSLLAPLPGGGGHNSRSIAVGPDGGVYLSLGITGNCSDQYLGADYPFRDRRGGLLVLREDAGEPHWEVYATGLRNPVGYDWQPGSGVLYASNNGPDHWGYEAPPEYFSRLTPGSFHGMPWFQYDGERIRRDDCVASPAPQPREAVVTPVATFAARSAPMGVVFVPPGALSATLVGDAVVALHGSWATRPSGGYLGHPATRRPPKLVLVRFDRGRVVRVDDLVTGFQLASGARWARPVGVAVGPDGALYFTSDAGAEALFRLRWMPQAGEAP